MSCLCKSLLCVAYSPPATQSPPCTAPARSDISTSFWLICLGSELANLIEDLLIVNVRVWFSWFSAHLFTGSNACARALREKKVAHVSPPVSVHLTISWHGGCNGAGQDRSGPVFVREWHLERAPGHIWGMWAVASTGNKFQDWRLSVPTSFIAFSWIKLANHNLRLHAVSQLFLHTTQI